MCDPMVINFCKFLKIHEKSRPKLAPYMCFCLPEEFEWLGSYKWGPHKLNFLIIGFGHFRKYLNIYERSTAEI